MKKLNVVLAAVIFAGALGAHADSPPTSAAKTKAGIIVGKETTFVDGPVLEDGTIDYCAAYNTLAGKGVTKENNAVALIATVLGSDWPANDTDVREAIFKIIGAEIPREGAPRVSSLLEFLHKKSNGSPASMPSQRDIDQSNLQEEAMTRVITEGESPELKEWVTSQNAALDVLVKASERAKYYVPMVPSAGRHNVPAVRSVYLRGPAGALQTRASFRLGAGDFEGARRDAKAVLQLGRLSRMSPTAIENLMGLAIEGKALNQYRTWATSGLLKADQLKAIRDDLASVLILSNDDRYFAERFFMLDLIMEIRRGHAQELIRIFMYMLDPKAKPSIGNLAEADTNVLLRAANASYDELWTIGNIKGYREGAAAVKARVARLVNSDVPKFGSIEAIDSAMGATMTRPKTKTVEEYLVRAEGESIEAYSNRMARLFFEQPSDMDSRFADVGFMYDQTWTLTEATLALAQYRIENGKYPGKPSDLSPKWLEKIPQDIFSEKEMIYRRAGDGYVLYSIGPNLKDDGGMGRKDKVAGADDVAVRVK